MAASSAHTREHWYKDRSFDFGIVIAQHDGYVSSCRYKLERALSDFMQHAAEISFRSDSLLRCVELGEDGGIAFAAADACQRVEPRHGEHLANVALVDDGEAQRRDRVARAELDDIAAFDVGAFCVLAQPASFVSSNKNGAVGRAKIGKHNPVAFAREAAVLTGNMRLLKRHLVGRAPPD